jgi:hypothetical protein
MDPIPVAVAILILGEALRRAHHPEGQQRR